MWSWAEQAVERARRAAPSSGSTVLAIASSSAFYRADYVTAHRLACEAMRDGIGGCLTGARASLYGADGQ